MKLSRSQLYAWLAALIDGEGSVMLNDRRSQSEKRKRQNPHYRAVISVCGTDMRLLREVMKQTGVHRTYQHTVGGDPRTPRKRSMWTWRLNNSEIKKWLPKIRPYLVIKGQQADLLLKALDIKHQLTPGNEGFLPKNRDGLSKKLTVIYLKIRQLNTRGRTVLEGNKC